jgi:hypothetical protein
MGIEIHQLPLLTAGRNKCTGEQHVNISSRAPPTSVNSVRVEPGEGINQLSLRSGRAIEKTNQCTKKVRMAFRKRDQRKTRATAYE